MNIVEKKINDEIRDSRKNQHKEMIDKLRLYAWHYAHIDGMWELIDFCRSVVFYMMSPNIGYDQYLELQCKFDETLKEIDELIYEEEMNEEWS